MRVCLLWSIKQNLEWEDLKVTYSQYRTAVIRRYSLALKRPRGLLQPKEDLEVFYNQKNTLGSPTTNRRLKVFSPKVRRPRVF